jgi:hypothetical protein
VTRHRIQPKAAVELETLSLRLPAPLLRAVDQYAKYLGGTTDRSHVITQAIEIALAQDEDLQRALSARPSVASVRPRPRHRIAAVPTYLQDNVIAGGAQPVAPASSRNTAVFTAALSASLGGQITVRRQ